MLMHASIVRKDGSPVSYTTAFTRWLIQMLIGLPSTIGLALLSRRTMSLVPAMLAKMTTGIGVPDTTDLGYGPLSTLPRPDQLLAPNATSSLPDLSILYLPMAILGVAILLQLLNACVVAIDSNHQGIHDKIAGTYVVRD
jgi:uncharacterized RDD family membrane protein YckC